MLTRKQLFLLVGIVMAVAIVALAVSWATTFGVDFAGFDGGFTLGRCMGSTNICTGV